MGILEPVDTAKPLLNGSDIITEIAVENDIVVPLNNPTLINVPMQTNGNVLRIDLNQAKSTLNLSKIIVEVADNGHTSEGGVTEVTRRIVVTRELVGPLGIDLTNVYGGQRLLLVLSDSIFYQDSQWQSRVVQVSFLEGWMAGALPTTISGGRLIRNDSLRYPPFPVKPVTAPFRRSTPITGMRFEVTGANEFGRERKMFARVEAWAHVAGVDGPASIATVMEPSFSSPADNSPSRLTVPIYGVTVHTDSLPEGVGEIRYRAFPFIGPPWQSMTHGEPFPTLSAPRGLPFCNDKSESWAPIFGVVSQSGSGLAGTDTSGLAPTLAAAVASGVTYRDCAALASAVRLFNRAALPVNTLVGPLRRIMPHDDIASGVAVLRPVAGSVPGSNFGCYTLRSAMSNQANFPPGATCFEIRGEMGTADPAVRLRGVDSTGVAVSSGAKGLPSRVILRGMWLDGGGLSGTAHIIADGTAAAGATTTNLHPNNFAYMVTEDCAITENPAAGTAAPARWRCGFVWDYRLRHEGITGQAAMGTVTTFGGIVCSVGSSYSRPTMLNGMPLTTLLAAKMRNVGVRDQERTAPQLASGRILMNVRFDYDVPFTSPMISLAMQRQSVGGLAVVNVFCRGTVTSGGPAVQISADGSFQAVDNLIMRYFSHDLSSANPSDGRCNILYQDQGYVRVEKIGTMAFCAFRSYNIKGDNFMAQQRPGSASQTYVATNSYGQGALVHDSAGAATSTSSFFQAIRQVNANASDWAPLRDASAWLSIGQVFGQAYGQQPRRQGNARFRYHIGSKGNVAATTYNGAVPGVNSGYGFAWSADGTVQTSFDAFFSNRAGDNYRPSGNSPLLNRVQAGQACMPFDLSGNARLDNGSGAAGAYERI
ncbi:hypothetical protein [Sandarakinorhabdus sp.]|uniref:hypothetical protein n=1 Tax=Sandarakinorhabdus sp. TaxID=1916663 RepID=UPI00286DFEB1|nr:hypothetical protein [Sandarakinorhabdus sp.]